jgi:hypothetical protein
VQGDLDWIVMKCLEKSRDRRYETVNGVALDLQRHLAHEPVTARPPSVAYRLKKMLRRNRLAIGTAGLVAAALAALVVAFLGWLAWDDAVLLQPLSVEQVAPLPPRGMESAAVALRFSEQEGRPPPAYPEMKTLLTGQEFADLTSLQEFLAANGDSIRADWEAGTALRDWIAALNACGTIGDIANDIDSPLLPFHTLRQAGWLHCAYAGVLAREGQGDAALAVLVPMLAVSRQLRPASRTFARTMSANVVQGYCQRTAELILASSTASPSLLRQLAAALEEGGSLPATLHQTFGGESAIASKAITDRYKELSRGWLSDLVCRLVFNPRATANLEAQSYEQIEKLTAERRFGELHDFTQAWFATFSRPALKNAIGRQLLALRVQAYNKMAAALWKKDDERIALLAAVHDRLAEIPPTPANP